MVHDLLTYLAQQMIMLNKEKQAELKRFLSWLESELRIALNDKASVGVEALTGKTILKNYLGDYQKGEAAAPLEALWRVLLENRRRIVRSLDPIFERAMRAEHEKSLSILLPIKTRLANTKWFIDQLVYRLYGLYEDEIAVVEGRR